jgi:aminopeptidase N
MDRFNYSYSTGFFSRNHLLFSLKSSDLMCYLILVTLLIYKTKCQAQLAEDVELCSKTKIDYFKKNARTNTLLKAHYPGDAAIDVKYYKLALEIDVTYEYAEASPLVLKYLNKNLNANTTIKATATANGTNRAIIDLQNPLIVDSVFVNNEKTTFNRPSQKIDIDLKKAYAKDELFTLLIYYHGTPGSSGFGSFTFGSHNSPGAKQEPAIWSLSEPYGASDWFPCKDNPADKADSSDVWITAPKYFVSVSNGILEQKIENTTTNTYKWKSRYPIANYLISITLANFELRQNQFDYGGVTPMPVDHYMYPEANTAANHLLMDETVFMLNEFTEKFGPYPFLKERYGHAQFGWGGGMEHQTCSSMFNFSSGLVAHELAHQWFGDEITCHDWQNIWLNEGFATYGALIYWEKKNGKADYKTRVNNTMTNAKNANGTVYVQDISSVGSIFNGARSYSKAGIILHMLRNIVGDTKFYDILRAYTSSIHSYGNATTENFQSIAESISGMDLAYFFSQWIYGEKFPKYQFGWATVTLPNAKVSSPAIKHLLKLQITQTINSPQPAYFTMPIDLKVTFEDNSSEIIRVFNDAQTQLFDIELSKKPVSVDFDPENGILKDLTIVPINLPLSLEEEKIKILEEEKKLNYANVINFQISPNPAQAEIRINFETNNKINYQIELSDILGKKLYQFSDKNIGKKISHIINTNNFTNGLYVIQVKIDDQILTRKVQINH